MRKALNRKLLEAYDLTEVLIYEMEYLKENTDIEFTEERAAIIEIKKSIEKEYEARHQIGVLMNVAECLRDANFALDHLYYKQNLMVQILKLHGLYIGL